MTILGLTGTKSLTVVVQTLGLKTPDLALVCMGCMLMVDAEAALEILREEMVGEDDIIDLEEDAVLCVAGGVTVGDWGACVIVGEWGSESKNKGCDDIEAGMEEPLGSNKLDFVL